MRNCMSLRGLRALAGVMGMAAVMLAAPALGDDHPGACDDASHWPVAFRGSPIAGVIEQPGDVDAFSLEMEPGYLYRFNIWSGESTPWARVRVMAPDCSAVRAEWDPAEFPQSYWFLAPPRDAHSARVERLVAVVDAPYGGSGAYRIPVELVGGPYTDDFPSSAAEAKQIQADGRDIRGSVEFGNDQDVFVINARPGGIYRLEVVEGLDNHSTLNAVIGAAFAENTPSTSAKVPGDGCQFGLDGCSMARVIAPKPSVVNEPTRLYVTVRNGSGEDDNLPPCEYVFRVVDEGDFVAAQGATTCEETQPPEVVLGEPIALDPPLSTWATQTFGLAVQADQIYRVSVEAVFGAPEMYVSVGGIDCLSPQMWMDPAKKFTAYFRGTAEGLVKITAGRSRVDLDVWSQPILGSCIVRIDNLGTLEDDRPDVLPSDEPATLSAGGRIEPGTLEFGGDHDVFAGDLAAGVRYRVEVRSLVPDAAVLVFGLADPTGQSVGFSLIGGAGGFTGRDLTLARGGRLQLDVQSLSSRSLSVPEPAVRYEVRIVRSGCRADWDGSGQRSAEDLFQYLSDYFDGRGEFDGIGSDGGVGDLLGFVQAWFGPCQ